MNYSHSARLMSVFVTALVPLTGCAATSTQSSPQNAVLKSPPNACELVSRQTISRFISTKSQGTPKKTTSKNTRACEWTSGAKESKQKNLRVNVSHFKSFSNEDPRTVGRERLDTLYKSDQGVSPIDDLGSSAYYDESEEGQAIIHFSIENLWLSVEYSSSTTDPNAVLSDQEYAPQHELKRTAMKVSREVLNNVKKLPR